MFFFKLGDLHLPNIMNFLGGATSLDFFLKAYKTKETKGFLPYEWLDCPNKMSNKELPHYDPFFSILRKSNTLEKECIDIQNLVNNGLLTEQTVANLRMDRKPPTGAEIFRNCKTSGRVITCNISQISSSGIAIKCCSDIIGNAEND